MTKQEAIDQLNLPNIRTRLGYFMAKAADNIILEDPATANHAARIALAKEVLKFPERYVDAFAHLLILNPTVIALAALADAQDSDIEFIVNAKWNVASALAGVT